MNDFHPHFINQTIEALLETSSELKWLQVTGLDTKILTSRGTDFYPQAISTPSPCCCMHNVELIPP